MGGGETFGGGTDGGGGRGEFACRFSGFGDPTTATELAALEDEAETYRVHTDKNEINCMIMLQGKLMSRSHAKYLKLICKKITKK